MDTMDTKEDPRDLTFVSLVSFVVTRTSSNPVLPASLLALLATTWTAAQSTVPVNDEFFETRIGPVLSSRCYACHSSRLAAPKGELVLDTRSGVLKGGRQGPAVVPGKPADSKLLEALTYANAHLQMPPSGKLADPIIADFERWIAGGAPDPRTEIVTASAPGKRVVGESELAKGRQWWAFQGVRELSTDALRAMVDKPTDALRAAAGKAVEDKPVASHEVRVRSKLDRFVLAKLAEKGLTPSPEADARTLIRRAYLDLIGLKPTYEEVEAYAADRRRTSTKRLVDRLLAIAAVRRALGPLLARRRALRRGQSRKHHQPSVSPRLALPRLGDRSAQQGRAVRPLRQAAARRRPDAGHVARRPAGARHHRARAAGSQGRAALERRHRDAAAERLGRARRRRQPRPARPDGRLRALPRSQVRSDSGRRTTTRLASVFASTSRALRPFFDIDPKTETRFMWVSQRMFDLHYTANLLRKRPGIEAGTGRAAGRRSSGTSWPRSRRRSTRCRRTYPADCGVHQDRAVSGREAARSSATRRHAQEARAAARREARCPVDPIPNRERVRNPTAAAAAAQADRPDSAVHQLGVRRRRVV